MKAYDLIIMPGRSPRDAGMQGWCFGLPPGIEPEQWPLDPCSGYPLCHGFTLRLPEEYRIHGPEIVGLSFFAVAAEHNDGAPVTTPRLANTILNPPPQPPAERALLPFWTHAMNAHPRLARMTDILGCAYAMILLTEAELDGPFCDVPEVIDSPLLRPTPTPGWISMEATSTWTNIYLSAAGRLPSRGDVTARAEASAVAFVKKPRLTDPNAGKAVTDPSYEDRLTETFALKPWLQDLAVNHIGGTMDAVQAEPSFGRHYIGFDEFFGGFNFGGGTAQLDFEQMAINWSCG
ncbi:hypothetical protein [uncultured Roseobacter sp.]|uniref:hypothetical protein n=1 Tax=uncultured Roseobacter sp. TaxID=114847 RepID=UPI00262D92A6|nr:hypothetical protein [uncultured Roseobacter sp.]